VNRRQPYDAVLIVTFGGPEKPEDVRPFLANVVRDKPIPSRRIEQVVEHYMLFGGVSPLPAVTRRQAVLLHERLRTDGLDLPVYVGMRYWKPLVADALREMARAGVRRAVGLIAAPHHSHASCTQYKQNVREARQTIAGEGLGDIEIGYVDSWFDHPDFIRANAANVRRAISQLDEPLRKRARIVFTAHSIPVAMADACRYREQLAASISAVMREVGPYDSALVYQSRTGRPQDPWLEPDVCDYLRTERQRGLEAVVLAPIGFVIDHIEVLYDLDVQAGNLCKELQLPMARARTLNDDPAFIDMMADLVRRTWDRGCEAIPLPIVGSRPLEV